MFRTTTTWLASFNVMPARLGQHGPRAVTHPGRRRPVEDHLVAADHDRQGASLPRFTAR